MPKPPKVPTAKLSRAQQVAFDKAIQDDIQAAALKRGDAGAILSAAKKAAGAAVDKQAAKAPAARRTTIGFAKKGNRTR